MGRRRLSIEQGRKVLRTQARGESHLRQPTRFLLSNRAARQVSGATDQRRRTRMIAMRMAVLGENRC